MADPALSRVVEAGTHPPAPPRVPLIVSRPSVRGAITQVRQRVYGHFDLDHDGNITAFEVFKALRRDMLSVQLKWFLLLPSFAIVVTISMVALHTPVQEPLWVRPSPAAAPRIGETSNFAWLALIMLPLLASFLMLDVFTQASFIAERYYGKRQKLLAQVMSRSQADSGEALEDEELLSFDAYAQSQSRRSWSEWMHLILFIVYTAGMVGLTAYSHGDAALSSKAGDQPVLIALLLCATCVVLVGGFARPLRVAILLRYRASTPQHIMHLSRRMLVVLVVQTFLTFYSCFFLLTAPPLLRPVGFVVDDMVRAQCESLNLTWVAAHCTPHEALGRTWFGGVRERDAVGPEGLTCQDDTHSFYRSMYAMCVAGRAGYTTQFAALAAVSLSTNSLLLVLFSELFSAFRLTRTTWEQWVRWNAPVPAYWFVASFLLALVCCPIAVAIVLHADPFEAADMGRQRAYRFPMFSLALGWVNLGSWLCTGTLMIVLQRQQLDSRMQPLWDCFLSYRVDTERVLVETIYDKLCLLGFKPYLDTSCLRKGERFEDGFAQAIFHTSVFVPVLSNAALDQIASKDSADGWDSLLLEQRLAIELKEHGSLRAIHPVLVGELVRDNVIGESGASIGDLYASFLQAPRTTWRHAKHSLVRVEGAVKGYLQRNGEDYRLCAEPPPLRFSGPSASVEATAKQIVGHQGSVLQGPPVAAVEHAVYEITQCIIQTRSERAHHGRRDGRSASQAEASSEALHTALLRAGGGWLRRRTQSRAPSFGGAPPPPLSGASLGP